MRESSQTWLVYDSACPLCRSGAENFEMEQGELHHVDTRTHTISHPVVREIRDARLDLDEGMVLKHERKLYQGADALYMMANLDTGSSFHSRFSRAFFRYRWSANLCYPFLKMVRMTAIRLKGAPPLRNLEEV